MSFTLIGEAAGPAIGTDSPLIKAKDRAAFTSAQALLDRMQALAADQEDTLSTVRAQAHADGLQEGRAEAQARLQAEIASFSSALSDIEDRYQAQVAEAAYAAASAIIGEIEDAQLINRLVAQVIARQQDEDGIAIHVSPAMADSVKAQLPAEEAARVVADESLSDSDCHIMTRNGKIIASLSVQMEILRHRWGLGETGEAEELAEA